MKAVVLRRERGAAAFVDAEVPPPRLRPGDVLVRVHAVSFNPIDVQLRHGAGAGEAILGRDLSGVVEAVHGDCREVRVGDEVFSYVTTRAGSGTYAEQVCVPEELVATKPATLDHASAAAVPVAGVTARIALDKLRACRSLFVAGGAGGVGTFAIQLARMLGIRRIVATAGSEASRAHLVSHCGLPGSAIVDYRNPAFAAQALKRNRGPFDGVLDLVGGTMLAAGCGLVATDGHVASVTEAPDEAAFESLFAKNASFHAVGAHAWSLQDRRSEWRRYRALLQELAWHFDDRELPPPRITHVGTLGAEVVERAHALLESRGVPRKLLATC